MQGHRQLECDSFIVNHHMVGGKFICPFKSPGKGAARRNGTLMVLQELTFKLELLKQYKVEILYQSRMESNLNVTNTG